MRPPGFWYRPPGLLAALLSPLGWLTATLTAARVRRPGTRAAVPVICVGNLAAGGTGKTPTVMALTERLHGRGQKVVILSRGHGGKLRGPVQVDLRAHAADDVGDEPLLLAAFAPVVVSKDRTAGAALAETLGAGVILMDDGFQNPGLTKDFSLIVVDAETGFGNGHCLPAGPLREPVAAGLSRAQAIMLIGPAAARAGFSSPEQLPVVGAELRPLETGMDWAGARVVAFAGIGRPEKFFATLRGLGAELLRSEALEDHQPLSTALLTRLEQEAHQLGAQLVTTEKDAARLPQAFRPRVLTLPVRLQLDDWSVLDMAFARLGL